MGLFVLGILGFIASILLVLQGREQVFAYVDPCDSWPDSLGYAYAGIDLLGHHDRSELVHAGQT